ncbi:hypothetical protein QBC46DRAFT_296733 [Diplogelasinospora grovesii]|uniref:Uncharacterized protein n=1 Tax=Diplogelasinospora grovesii TaxID=303347 RepID=A0AAN6MZW9_9PEZI|nr:hypothetical protein QBC46DRAFT_296733 [Diplogelasinospora grovesii]
MADSDLGNVLLTRTWLFQAIVAGPIFVIDGIAAILNLYDTDTWSTYEFIANLFTAILEAGIIFVVLVQRRLPEAGPQLTFHLEVVKSSLATALWIWLMADAIWGPVHHWYYIDRRPGIPASAISSILLFLLFYPTVFWTSHVRKMAVAAQRIGDDEDDEEGSREDEDARPLLQG